MSSWADLYYAFDEEGLYVVGVVTEGLPAIDLTGIDVIGLNRFNYSTGFDGLDLDVETGYNSYGWNGDVMAIMVDPFGSFVREGFSGASDEPVWYMVGLFEGDKARVYKSQTPTDGEITDQIKAAGKKSAAGWNFEVMIPWDMIIADTNDCSMELIKINKEELIKEGTYLRVGALYHDRFFDDEQGMLQHGGVTLCYPRLYRTDPPGNIGVDDNIASYGIEIDHTSATSRTRTRA